MQDTINDRLRRMRALTHKEFLEVGRDKSSLMMGILLPIILILVIGFGISLDVKNAPIAVVLEDNAPEARQMVNFVDGSEYFKPVYMTDIYQAVQAFETRKVDAILRVPPDFSRQLHQNNARLQLILYGVDTTTAMTLQSYVEAGVSQWTGEYLAAAGAGRSYPGKPAVVQRCPCQYLGFCAGADPDDCDAGRGAAYRRGNGPGV